MSTQKNVLRIEELRNRVAGQMEVAGELHDVLQMDFETHHDLNVADGTANGIDALRVAVQKVVPSLAAETVARFNLDQAQAILTLSGAGITGVERMFPNAIGPESSTSPA
jgi:hypothetical protein